MPKGSDVVVVAAVDWIAAMGLIALLALVGWLLAAGNAPSPDGEAQGRADDPNTPDENGFTPADGYGYGYDYSWGDPFGDKDL